MKTVTLGVKIDAPLRDRLKKLAVQKERSPHWLVKAAIAEFVAREEAYEKERKADERRWRNYETSSTWFEQDEVAPWLEKLAAGENTPWPK